MTTYLPCRPIVVASLALWMFLAGSRSADAQATPGSRGEGGAPVHVFVQAGVGLTELAHLEGGVFLGPHLSLEADVAWSGVFGARYGGGLIYAIGHAQGARPPRHALLVGARLMLNSDATFDSHGDELSSYGVVPVGYGFLADSGFYLRATVGPTIVRERTSRDSGAGVPVIGHELSVAGPMFNVAAGIAF